LFFDGKFIKVSGNERVPAFILCPEKITLSSVLPNIFSFKTFLIPLFLKGQCRKKKAQTQMGNDSQSKKKVSGCERHRKGYLSKKGLKLAEE